MTALDKTAVSYAIVLTKRDEVKAAINWLEKQGVNVEPVEIGAIAG